MVDSRTKGASAEREFARLIYDWVGVRLVRNLEQARGGGHDLIVHPDEAGHAADTLRKLAFECKRYASVRPGLIKDWWQQTCKQAEQAQLYPVLAYRANRQDWRVIIPLYIVNNELMQNNSLECTAELSPVGFCAVLGELEP